MNSKSLISAALSAPRCIISIARDHANEDINGILNRKINDIKKVGLTFWFQKSPGVIPPLVRSLCASEGQMYAFFIEPSSKGNKQHREKSIQIATEYSEDNNRWRLISQSYPGLGQVTSEIGTPAYALVFDKLEIIQGTPHPSLDLWNYADSQNPQMPINLGGWRRRYPAVCAVKKNMSNHHGLLKSRHRRIVAVARLVEPYGVFLR